MAEGMAAGYDKLDELRFTQSGRESLQIVHALHVR
jgi:hypothetical protein